MHKTTPTQIHAVSVVAAGGVQATPTPWPWRRQPIAKRLFDLATFRVFESANRDVFPHYVGFLYVACTLFFSIRFLVACETTLQNDLFWSEFNSTSGGVYVANVFNTMLLGRTHQSFKLSNPEYAAFGTTNVARPQIVFPPTYPRSLVFHRLNTPEVAITSLRRPESNQRLLFKHTQFCWVDFERRFSIAHTSTRAARCLADNHTITNGAVYLESYLRNFDADIFLGTWGPAYACGIKKPLEESPEGRVFVDSIESIWNKSKHFTVAEELAHWHKNGITHYTMQWGNLDLAGVTEHIEFISALGVRTNFTIKTISPATPGKRTTDKMFWTPINDFWAVDDGTTGISGMSLVRGTSTFYENANYSVEQVMINDGLFPFPFTPKDRIFREVIGTFGTVDMHHLLFADSLFDLWMNASRIINEILLSNPAAQQAFHDIPADGSLDYEVFPSAWRPLENGQKVWSNIGGNPLCSDGTAVMYLQKYLDYNDGCTGSFQELIRPTRVTFIVAQLAIGNPGPAALELICPIGIEDLPDKCVNDTVTTSQFIKEFLSEQDKQTIQSLTTEALQDLLQLNLELIQYVVNNTNDSHYELLRHPVMMPDPQDPWNLFGWWYALDWVIGTREVVRFEGDVGTLTLISARTTPVTLDLRGTEIPTNMSVYFLRIVQYTTAMSILSAILALFYAVVNKGHIAGSNLLRFNRVTGAVWIGRPLVVARGIVAMCMISTSEVLLTLHDSVIKFDEAKRAWYNVLITAGESCWFSYVTVDVIVTVTQGYTAQYAFLSSVLVQIINSMADFVAPFQHTAEIDLQCEMVVFYQEVACRSGRVEIGSVTRFVAISAIAVGITLLTFVVLRLTMAPIYAVQGGKMLLSGIAKEVLISDGWMHDGRWYLDKASALLAGLVTFNVGGHSRVLDVKTWTLLYLHNNRLSEVPPEDPSSNHPPGKDEPVVANACLTPWLPELPANLKYGIALSINIGNDLQPMPRGKSQRSRRLLTDKSKRAMSEKSKRGMAAKTLQ